MGLSFGLFISLLFKCKCFFFFFFSFHGIGGERVGLFKENC